MLTLAAATGGCSFELFSDISDLEDEVWVDVSGAPSGIQSNNYPVGLAFAGGSEDGVRILAIGGENTTVTANVYDARGNLEQFDSPSLNDQVVVGDRAVSIGDPMQRRLAIAHDNGTNLVVSVFDAADNVAQALDSVELVGHTGTPSGMTTTMIGELVVAGGNQISLIADATGGNVTTCDDLGGSTGAAVAADLDGQGEKLLVMVDQDLQSFSLEAVRACLPGTPVTGDPLTLTAPAGAGAGFGDQMVTGDFDADGDDELAVADPTATADGAGNAGTVFVFEQSGDSFGDPVLQLHDFDPESNQQFGRTMTVAKFGEDRKSVV